MRMLPKGLALNNRSRWRTVIDHPAGCYSKCLPECLGLWLNVLFGFQTCLILNDVDESQQTFEISVSGITKDSWNFWQHLQGVSPVIWYETKRAEQMLLVKRLIEFIIALPSLVSQPYISTLMHTMPYVFHSTAFIRTTRAIIASSSQLVTTESPSPLPFNA